ncbi:HopJ type III effector protein [Mariniflexile sp. AS56]|uniref:HopJ type III effector protein n=1 Tax=Mariniflexile sp. AS56 TaxID=3063957 RepID=UPI0026EA4A09|nr:HopJ type III effector protein [Mariniflexile sp. AS56]MDO7172068.1 HopJ type III effector protein [Mariniflexile sp. AS56]
MNLEVLKNTLKETPKSTEFTDTMEVIESNYNFTPTAFKNGDLQNNAGENSGSCKLFAFAKLQGFSKEETLACFGKFYFEDVLNDLNGAGHQNIRNFMKTGFEGLTFDGEPLKLK